MWEAIRGVPWWGWVLALVVIANVAVVLFGWLAGRACSHAVKSYEEESER